MLKQPGPTPPTTTRPAITSLVGRSQLLLDATPQAISPGGGLASFISFLRSLGFAQEGPRHLPFAAPASTNPLPLAHALPAFLRAGGGGASRFARGERAARRSRPARPAGPGALSRR